MDIRAALPTPDGETFRIVTLELREPERQELCVKIIACGICHTDLMMMSPGSLTVYGHEASGIIEAVGPETAGFAPGDHVVLSYPSCGVCSACRDMRPYDCDWFGALFSGERLSGTQPLSYNGQIVRPFFGQGGFATHTVVHASSAVKVDKDLDLRLLGPLGCGFQTGAGSVMNYLKPKEGDSIVILGSGSVGLSAVLAARLLGCSPIIAVDRLASRLALARTFGATHVINPGESTNLAQELMDISDGLQYAFDSTGSVRLMETAVACLKKGGKGCGVAASGVPRIGREAAARDISWHEIIQGCAVPRLFIPLMIDFFKEGRFTFEQMITFFNFDDINDAIRQAEAYKIVKPVLIM